uniref:Immunoglobulin domain-containing protein n=1 Tax=Varanus komodoensis TaxID=61221 RepID=A0A8D2LD31_VARKO
KPLPPHARGEVGGRGGGSLSVICNYTKGYEKNAKFWCKVEPGFFLDSCPVLIESGSKDETRQGNIYIKDNKEKHYFEVTMDNLRMEDSGIYKCGIHRTVFIDIKHRVTVNVMFTGKHLTYTLNAVAEMLGLKWVLGQIDKRVYREEKARWGLRGAPQGIGRYKGARP